jgi:hypothetical protein
MIPGMPSRPLRLLLLMSCSVLVSCGGSTSLKGPEAGTDGSAADASSNDASQPEGSVPDGAPVEAGMPCTKTQDCASLESPSATYVCGFAIGAGCAATGVCVMAGPLCNGIPMVACGCDKQDVPYGECAGYPAGYAGAPVAYEGACE